jgi:phage terminase small subunit
MIGRDCYQRYDWDRRALAEWHTVAPHLFGRHTMPHMDLTSVALLADLEHQRVSSDERVWAS